MPQNIPLGTGEMALPSGAVLPSGEANFFDFEQQGKALNATYPSPADFTGASGVRVTSPVNPDLASELALVEGSGIQGSLLAPTRLNTPFSNTESAASGQISDFTIFNSYVHYYQSNSAPVYINYSLAFEQVVGWDRYVNREVASGEEDEEE